MHIIFVRHGARRSGESDPELTSWGRRMAAETGQWIGKQGIVLTAVRSTPTRRTQQTAAEITAALALEVAITHGEVPEELSAWGGLLDAGDALLLVGHHPTMDMLRHTFRLSVPRSNFASAVVLESTGAGWTVVSSWPGRPS